MKKKVSTPGLRIMDLKIRWILAFSMVAFILFLVVLFQQKGKQEYSSLLVGHTNRVIQKVDTVALIFNETDASTRAYLLSLDTNWQNRLFFLHKTLNQTILDLQNLTVDNPPQQETIKKLEQLSIEQQNFQHHAIQKKWSIDSIILKFRINGEGPVITGKVKEVLNNIRQIEEGLLVSHIAQNESSYKTSIYIAFACGIFALLLVMAILTQLNFDINLRKKVEIELADSEVKYRKLIENAGSVMYTTDATGLITFANNRVAELTEYIVDELYGKHFSILLDPNWAVKVISFYKDQYLKKTAASQLEFQIRTKSGKQKWVEQAAQLLIDDNQQVHGFQCMVKDITERKMVEQELNKSENQRKENEYLLHAILDNSTALIYIKDLEGRYVMVNNRFKTFFAITEETVIGKTDYDFNPKELSDYFKETDNLVITTLRPIETEELIDTPWGNRNLLLLKFPLITPEGELLGVSGIATDVTDKTEMQRQTIDALKRAESAQQIQEQFLANMSHEIRTPMNGIQGMTRLLLETSLTDEQKRFTSIISRSLNNLVVIVNNVLDFSNLKAGKLVIDSIIFDLPELLEEVKKYFEPVLSAKNLGFLLTIEKDLPHSIKGDSFRLKQILTNLIGNAIKFTDKGSISLKVSVLEQDTKQASLRFILADTGIGIPKDKQVTIFESFAQAGKKISSVYGGTGLGLTISKGLIELQGGVITVQSEPGEGSVFTFFIPFELAVKETVAAEDDYTRLLGGKRILVVEDNQINQRLIDFVLKKVNIKADLASNGDEAIKLCEKNPPYDLVIMDLQMPIMDGYETTIYMRQEMKLTIPIIAMTATALRVDQERSAEVGMNDFMIKPFDFNDLYTRLIRLLYSPEEKNDATEPLFDLSLLNELGDANSVLEVLTIFQENTPADIKKLEEQSRQGNQPELYKLAHKLKSAVSTIQSKQLTELLNNIEQNAKNGERTEETKTLVAEVVLLFEQVEKVIQEEMERIRKQGGTNN